MSIFNQKIFLTVMLCFQSFQNIQAASSKSLGTWNTWRAWMQNVVSSRRMRQHGYREDRAIDSVLRGGSSCDDNVEVLEHEEDSFRIKPIPSGMLNDSNKKSCPVVPSLARKTHRCTQDIIFDLLKRSSTNGKRDSIELRRLITTRSADYLEDLRLAVEAGDKKLPQPRKLLHFLAPKVPAIKHSPDVNLRIHSARSDFDSSIAACIIGTLAHVSEVYDKQVLRRGETKEDTHSVARDLICDRRFEQLVECVLNGVNIQKRKKQSLTQQLDKNSDAVTDIEQVLDEEDAHIDDGLNVRDACRAAWGMSVLGCCNLETLGDVKVLDLLMALSLRIRELLLARLQLIRQNDLFPDPSSAHMTTSERLNEVVEELAEDAAAAMWAFACVKACTGLRSVPLFETCCSILCQDPIDMRKRAQSAEYEPGVPIGVHDVVDRLAEAESIDKEQENDGCAKKNNTAHVQLEGIGVGKDAFLDWLSPAEVNDVLWAIALHGSNNTSASDEVTLSETASALREIAFDRLLEWLSYDFALSLSSSNGNDKGENPLEVVDAAALLALSLESNDPSKLTEDRIPIENISLSTENDVKEIEVVDAAALLASTSDENREMIKTETITAPANLIVTKSEEEAVGALPSEDSTRPDGYKTSSIFTLHDLASMAWSVTELRDPLQVRIVGMIACLVDKLGRPAIKSLGGGDLANLAWAISRFSAKSKEAESNGPIAAAVSVLSRIAHHALQRVVKERSVLKSFQPPELGRLAWAIANTLSAPLVNSKRLKQNPEVMELLRLSLEASASNSELFATEDLLRIAWAFLEICGDNDSMITLSVSDGLGSILASVMQSLHHWERGKTSTTQYEVKDASVFSSFFGKSRMKHHLLEHAMNDGDDDDESALTTIFEKSRKPLLRDLTVDPATLIRAACGYQRLSRRYPNMNSAWALTRVAIRLLVSKNARLMKECSIHDIIRLCEATVLAEVDGHRSDLVAGLFARKVLQVLNAANDKNSETIDSSIDISQASSAEICTLIWSLGELGVKHFLHDDARRSAYKRMHFVCESGPLTASEIDNLDHPSLLKLLRGTALMNYLASDKAFVLNVLEAIEKKYPALECHDLCCVAESIALLKDGMPSGHLRDATKDNGEEAVSETNPVGEDKTDDERSVESERFGRVEPSPQLREAMIERDLKHCCDAILANVGVLARKKGGNLSLAEIRRLLAVYSLLPFQDDPLIESLASEVGLRKKHLDLFPGESLGNLVRTARSSAEFVKGSAIGHMEAESVVDQLKNGLVSFFSSLKQTQAKERDSNILAEELLTSVQNSIDRASMVSKSAEDLQVALGVSLDSIFSSMARSTAFELAQCKELIENYHRVNFVTGTFRSRYDKTRGRDIAKRVLSRLLP